ncbi:MAG: hypothetical protein AB1758_22855, partial [Candidatus Eremiobacterota bacterium]
DEAIERLSQPYQPPPEPLPSSLPGPWNQLEAAGLLGATAPLKGPLPLPRPELMAMLQDLEKQGVRFLKEDYWKLSGDIYSPISAEEIVDRIERQGTEFDPIYLLNERLKGQEMPSIGSLAELREADAIHRTGGGTPLSEALRSLAGKGFLFSCGYGEEQADPLTVSRNLARGNGYYSLAGNGLSGVYLELNRREDALALDFLLGSGVDRGLEHGDWLRTLNELDRLGYSLDRYGSNRQAMAFSVYRSIESPDSTLWVLEPNKVAFPLKASDLATPAAALRKGRAAAYLQRTYLEPLARAADAKPEDLNNEFMDGVFLKLPMLEPEQAGACIAALVMTDPARWKGDRYKLSQEIRGSAEQMAMQLGSPDPNVARRASALEKIVEFIPLELAWEGSRTVSPPVARESLVERSEIYMAVHLGAFDGRPVTRLDELNSRYETVAREAFAEGNSQHLASARKTLEKARRERIIADLLNSDPKKPDEKPTGVQEGDTEVIVGGVVVRKKRD